MDLNAFAATVTKAATETKLWIPVAKFFVDFYDAIIGSSAIRNVPQGVMDSAIVSNRVCRFVRNEVTFGTGVLIGPRHVLTAAHLFFDGRMLAVNDVRAKEITVEFDTLVFSYAGLASAGVRAVDLEPNAWLLDPCVVEGEATRNVDELDYAIVILDDAVGEDLTGPGSRRRDYFRVPAPHMLHPLREERMIQVFQYNDREALRSSIGRIVGISRDPLRVRYTASTLNASSGSPLLNDEHELVGIHVSGASEEFPRQNQGLPLRLIASSMEEQMIRATLQRPPNAPACNTNIELPEVPRSHWGPDPKLNAES